MRTFPHLGSGQLRKGIGGRALFTTCCERERKMGDLFSAWWFWVGLLAIAGLVGVLIYLRNHRPED